jgi:hypothetical protein
VTVIRIALGLVILLAAASSGQAQEQKAVKQRRAKRAAALEPPAGPPPTFMLVSKVDTDAGQLTLHYRQAVPVMETREVEVEIDGMKVRQTRVYTVMRSEDRAQLLSFDTIVSTAGGKTVETDDAWKALRGQIVLVTSAEKLDPAYVKLLSKDTVTIETKPTKPQP